MLEFLTDLYEHSGEWGDPILFVSIGLFITGWVMMFTVRMVKRFLMFIAVALLLPNGIGIVGYLNEADSLHEAVMERGEEISDEVEEAMEDLTFSPLYLGVIGSVVTGAVGVAGVMRVRRKGKPKE